MKKRAIILDLDNTIYPVSSIGNELFHDLFKLIESSGEYEGSLEKIKQEIMRIPFQKVMDDFLFSPALKDQCLQHHENLTYKHKMYAFEDYKEVREIRLTKFLVTSGFTKLQESKIEQLGIKKDFESVHIIDLNISTLSKKDVFQSIAKKYNYLPAEVLVIGDDLKAEIKAGIELGMEVLLYDREAAYSGNSVRSIQRFNELEKYL